MVTNNKIYYAHSKRIYGTPQEAKELEFLIMIFPKANIICPHNTIGELNDFKDYLYVVDCCNKIITSEIDGFIGRGVFCEIARAFGNGTQVSVLRKQNNQYSLSQVIGIEIINQNAWKNNYGKLIVKQ